MMIYENFPTVEEILSEHRNQIGDVYAGYRNHVYRMIHFCLAFRECTETEKQKIFIAGAFHDIGIWTEDTLDYLPPSIELAAEYLKKKGLQDWEKEITLMIDMHHKLTEYKSLDYPLVEVFRKADLADFSLGAVKNGLSESIVSEVKNAFPNSGFHKFLTKLALKWAMKHPLNPAPIMKW
ncbi:MAG TPA: hypothetical protein PK453_12490 [Leptospiraceae bacterium]|nr:hypothetical protein [Leptospiraceae bacterium]HMY66510.1 hypothetical protein [Leptospiraceae bacterium]HNF14481.1 hypothetical protein [Leptospiraceae bacterium]HNF24523.1 hypothetical protein [Leptospiraceae bacterium]HNH06934.1 hypothetical protein [Leptospiraceae bacterium]